MGLLQKIEVPLCNYLINQQHNEDTIQEKITAMVDSNFRNSYSLKLSTPLNQFMVNFDIICILNIEMGFKCWTDLTELERSFRFKNYTTSKQLPDWNMEEESYNS